MSWPSPAGPALAAQPFRTLFLSSPRGSPGLGNRLHVVGVHIFVEQTAELIIACHQREKFGFACGQISHGGFCSGTGWRSNVFGSIRLCGDKRQMKAKPGARFAPSSGPGGMLVESWLNCTPTLDRPAGFFPEHQRGRMLGAPCWRGDRKA
jgi:hypothetical protein